MKKLAFITLCFILTGFIVYISYDPLVGCFGGSDNFQTTSLDKNECVNAGSKSTKAQKIAFTDKASFQKKMGEVCQKACGAKNYSADQVVAQKDAKVDDLTKCPVSGAVFQVKTNNTIVNHKDRSYYTCCGSCGKIFTENPETFALDI